MRMEGELIGEFKGKNTVYRVLPDGIMEVSNQGMGKSWEWMLHYGDNGFDDGEWSF